MQTADAGPTRPVNVVRPLRRLCVPDELPVPPRARWYAAYTNAREEQTANYNIRRAGFWTFFPVVLITVNHARRQEDVLRPYLPRYVFAQVMPRQDVFAINMLPGVSSVVCGADGPVAIDDASMARFMALARPDGLVVTPEPEPVVVPTFAAGDRVRLTGGPFEGYSGTVEWDTGKQVRVAVDGCSAPMSVPGKWVERRK